MLNSSVEINNDGVFKGKLRVLKFDFTSENGMLIPTNQPIDPKYPSPAEDKVIYEQLSNERFFLFSDPNTGRITGLSGRVISKTGYLKLFDYILSKFGKPDSTLDASGHRIDTVDLATSNRMKEKQVRKFNDIRDWLTDTIAIKNEIDTSEFNYYFHSNNAIIVLKRSSFWNPVYYVPFEHLSQCELYQYSKNFNKEVEEIKKSILDSLKPADVITIRMYYYIHGITDKYGIKRDYLDISVNLSPSLRKTSLESREIESMKGRIIIYDRYKKELQTFYEIEINAFGSLPARDNGNYGLAYVFNGTAHELYRPNSFNIKAYIGHKDNSVALKQAIALKQDLSIEFIPDAILFKDGTILK